MCNFISWIEYKGENFFIDNLKLQTKEGKKLLLPEFQADIKGHGAIRHYYPELNGKGKDRECTDFSTPDNFPKDIAQAFKKGQLSKIGICLDVLNDKGRAEYQKIRQSARAKIIQDKKYIKKEWQGVNK